MYSFKEDANKIRRVEIERTAEVNRNRDIKTERTEELIFGLYKRLDKIIDVLEKIESKNDQENLMNTSAGSSTSSCPSPSQLTRRPAKKVHNLYLNNIEDSYMQVLTGQFVFLDGSM